MDWLEWTEKTGDTRLAETAKVEFLALDSDESLLWPATNVKPQEKAHKVNNLRKMAVVWTRTLVKDVLAFFIFIYHSQCFERRFCLPFQRRLMSNVSCLRRKSANNRIHWGNEQEITLCRLHFQKPHRNTRITLATCRCHSSDYA